MSQDTKQQPQLLQRRYRAVKGSVEMLAAFEQPSLKSARAMVEDAESLLDAATQLHAAMEPTKPANQTSQNPTKAIFKHRFDVADVHDQIEVVDAINRLTRRSKSLLLMLSGQFEEPGNRLSDEIIANIIYAAIDEIDDIHDVINVTIDGGAA